MLPLREKCKGCHGLFFMNKQRMCVWALYVMYRLVSHAYQGRLISRYIGYSPIDYMNQWCLDRA